MGRPCLRIHVWSRGDYHRPGPYIWLSQCSPCRSLLSPKHAHVLQAMPRHGRAADNEGQARVYASRHRYYFAKLLGFSVGSRLGETHTPVFFARFEFYKGLNLEPEQGGIVCKSLKVSHCPSVWGTLLFCKSRVDCQRCSAVPRL